MWQWSWKLYHSRPKEYFKLSVMFFTNSIRILVLEFDYYLAEIVNIKLDFFCIYLRFVNKKKNELNNSMHTYNYSQTS